MYWRTTRPARIEQETGTNTTQTARTENKINNGGVAQYISADDLKNPDDFTKLLIQYGHHKLFNSPDGWDNSTTKFTDKDYAHFKSCLTAEEWKNFDASNGERWNRNRSAAEEFKPSRIKFILREYDCEWLARQLKGALLDMKSPPKEMTLEDFSQTFTGQLIIGAGAAYGAKVLEGTADMIKEVGKGNTPGDGWSWCTTCDGSGKGWMESRDGTARFQKYKPIAPLLNGGDWQRWEAPCPAGCVGGKVPR